MRTGWSDTRNKYKELITERVVGQMFLPGVVGVDRFKTKFTGVGSLAVCMSVLRGQEAAFLAYTLCTSILIML